MAVKFFCDRCGKEIFQEMDKATKDYWTISQIEHTCICSDCLLKEVIEDKNNNEQDT